MEVPYESSPSLSLEEIVEGRTRLLVPSGSMTGTVPPKEPAFFNPRARLNRDLSTVAYAAFLRGFRGPGTMLEGLGGTGARGIRAANEAGAESVTINDVNPAALAMAGRSAGLNGLGNVSLSRDEACRFLAGRSRRGERGAITDIDPFGSPAPFLDCGIRATMHGGLLSVTATDLQVLNGLFGQACARRYGGTPVPKTHYGNETAIRLILGCVWSVAARLGVTAEPLFVESDMHYYRAYVRVLVRPDRRGAESTGHLVHCRGCGHRELVAGAAAVAAPAPAAPAEPTTPCRLCGSAACLGGPLWTGRIFDAGFAKRMLLEVPGLEVDAACGRIIGRCVAESGMPGTYFTLDEVAARAGASPPKLGRAIGALRDAGFAASPTSLDPTGFRTTAEIGEITRTFRAIG